MCLILYTDSILDCSKDVMKAGLAIGARKEILADANFLKPFCKMSSLVFMLLFFLKLL